MPFTLLMVTVDLITDRIPKRLSSILLTDKENIAAVIPDAYRSILCITWVQCLEQCEQKVMLSHLTLSDLVDFVLPLLMCAASCLVVRIYFMTQHWLSVSKC